MSTLDARHYDRVNSALFVALFLLQYADLHSTVTAGSLQVEGNRLLTWLGHLMSPISAVFAVKGLSLVALAALRRAWSGGGHGDDVAWLAFLGAALLVYLAVVVNNYAAR